MTSSLLRLSTRYAALSMFLLAGCSGEARQPISVVLQPEKGGDAVTLQIPKGYIEQPAKLEGPLPNVLLRVPANDFAGATAFVAESEVRILIEPVSGNADAGKELQAAALRRPKNSEDAIVRSKELSKPGQIAYTFPNGKEEAESYYFTSSTGDVFVDCWRSVCKAYKTWNKRFHLRFDYQPASAVDVKAVDSALDGMLQTFAAAPGAQK